MPVHPTGTVSHSTGLSHQEPFLIEFLSCIISCPRPAHAPVLGRTNPEHCYSDGARCYEPSLPNLHDKPFMVFIFLLCICHSDFTEDTQAVRTQEQPKPKVCPLLLIFLTFQSSRRALGCLKPIFLLTNNVVTFYVCARGEQISNLSETLRKGWVLAFCPQILPFLHDF